MPPRGIVKSGNAGNSSKTTTPQTDPDAAKPLFPQGSKYPLSLLNERCQKIGWEKPIVNIRKIDNLKFSFVVVLTRVNKKTSQKESVRFEPYPPYTRPTSAEASHWGATYALYRFCNGIQLNLVLPPGPREYWNELAAEHKSVPEHQKWMYDPDPFAASQMVQERQQKVAKQKEAIRIERTHSSGFTKEYSNAPEVKMASSLRDLVQEAIRKTMSLHHETEGDISCILESDDAPMLLNQLATVGFKPDQSRKAVDFLSKASPFASNLLSVLSPLEASIQYLLLQVPECDLPQRFMSSVNSSEPFVTGVHSGTDDLKTRWLEEAMVKDGGWPSHVVKDALKSNPSFVQDRASLVAYLGRRLLGDIELSYGDCEEIDLDGVASFGGSYVEPDHLVVPLPVAPFKLHIILSTGGIISTNSPPIYISSTSVPPYVRLHLLARILLEAAAGTLIGPSETFLGSCMRIIEEEWINIEDKGPPDVSAVLHHLIPRRPSELGESNITAASGQISGTKVGHRLRRGDNRTDNQVKDQFEAVCREDKYQANLAARIKLPAFAAKDHFLSILEKNRVIVVVGETGSGKTTQIPQFILDSLILSNRGSSASILITQPRRLSAISVAARVSDERLSDGSVGYAIRGESRQNAQTKLLFCTTGIVLRRIASGDQLNDVTHILVDEVHERSVDGDFLLLELKELLHKNTHLKVVLMSATINHETFVKYFNGAPLITIPGFTHPVEDLYLEDVIPLLDYYPQGVKITKKMPEDVKYALQQELREKGIDDLSINAIQNICRSDRIDYQLITTVANYIVTYKPQGGILIFLTGVQEIRQCMQALNTALGTHADILPLHANLSNDEQRAVFRTTKNWKIVVATNVAETSITIEDIIYIIDSGKVKQTQHDSDSGVTRLIETWTSRAAGRQRRGRAGRTQPGVCYKLYTRQQESTMPEFSVPEILRAPLDSISLSVKATREDEDVKTFLSKAIDPPETSAINNAWKTLKELGAIDEADAVTALGRHMATMPVDLRLAKMMILGTIFQCLGPVLTVAACLSSKPLFLNPMDKRDEASAARLRFAIGGSDLLTDVHAYEECARLRSEGKSQSFMKSFCDENFISISSIRDITSFRQDLFSNLAETGFIPFSSKADDPYLNANNSNCNLIKAVILGGLWPRVARVHLPKSAIKFDKVQAGTVQRENLAKEFKFFDLNNERVFLHPTSILFGETTWKSSFLTYFNKQATSKVFLRDATQVPIYALLLFGGSVSVNHVAGGLTVDGKLRFKAWPRIGVLVNQLRRLLDLELDRSVKQQGTLAGNSLVVKAMLELISSDGLTV